MKRRVLSLLLTLSLLLGLLPAAAFASENVSGQGAGAGERADGVYQVAQDTAPIALTAETRAAHADHQACGVDPCPTHLRTLYKMYWDARENREETEESHSATGITWKPLNSGTVDEFLKLAENNKDSTDSQYWYYYLDGDLTIDGTGWDLKGIETKASSVSANYTICLNGNTITCNTTGDKPAITVGAKGKSVVLNICDCDGNGEIKIQNGNPAIQVNQDATVNLYSGTITGENKNGTGVVVIPGSSNVGSDGYGSLPTAKDYHISAWNSGSFYMNGGKITNTATGVNNTGRFDMVGGEISGNGTGVRYQENEYVGDGDDTNYNSVHDNCTVYFRLGAGAVIRDNTTADLNPVERASDTKMGSSGNQKSQQVKPRVTLTPEDGEIKWVPMKLKYEGTVLAYNPDSDSTSHHTAITDDNEADYSRYFFTDQYVVVDFVDEDKTYPYGADKQKKQNKHHVRLVGNSEGTQITVSTQPSLPSLPTGGSLVGQELTVTATGGSGTLKYQWYYSEEDTTSYIGNTKVKTVPNGTTATCTIPNLAATDAEKTYYFFCVITDKDGHITVTKTVKVTFPKPGELKITSQPSPPELTDGEGPVGKTLSVTAEGGSGNLGYQWYYAKNSTGDGEKIRGATENSFEIGQYSNYSANPTYFYCVITDQDPQKSVTTDRVEVNFGARITQQPKAPTGNPVGKTLTVEAEKPSSKDLEYQWYWNDSKTTEGGRWISSEESNTMTIPDPGEGVKVRYYWCVITSDGSINTTTDVVTVNFSGGGSEPPVIDKDPVAPSVAEGQSPVGQTITAPTVSGGGGGYKYQWYYNTADSTTGGTEISPGGTSASCKIPELDPGTYYFYCVVKGADGGEAVTNTVKIVIPDSAGLKPGQTITLDDGTKVNRSDDGGTVTITPPAGGGSSTVTTVTLPDSDKNGEVAVNKSTGEVSPPEGSKVTTTGGSGGGTKPEITIGSGGGSVAPGGEVKLPEGGTATVGGGAGGSPVTTITGGSGGTGGTTGGTTVTPKDDGTVEVGQGGTVTTGGTSGGTGTPVTLPNGGSVKPEDGTVTPTDKLIATGEDNNGDGVPDTLIVLPDNNGVKPDASGGGITLPNGTQVQGGGANSSDGTGGASVTLPSGGTISSEGGVKPDGKVTTGADGKTEVTLPTGGELKGDGEGGLTVPGGTTVKNDTNGPTVTVGGGSGSGGGNGGALDKDGGVKLPEGGVATVDNGPDGSGNNKPGTTITGGSGGSTVTSNPDGTTGVTGGTTVKTGDNGTEVTVNDNGGQGGKVTSDGGIQLPGGGSVTVGGGSGGSSGGGQGGTTITVPADGTGGTGGTGTTVQPGENGKVTAPEGSKVKTETGGGSTPGGGGQSGTEITLPKGGEVDATDGAVTPTGGVAGVDTDGDGKADTLITLPSGGGGTGSGTIKPNDQGGVDVPGGTELAGTTDGTNPNSQKVVLGVQGGSVNGEGGVDLPKGGTATVDNGSGAGKTNSEITAGENGGAVKPNPDGSADVSGSGTTIQVGGGGSTKPPVAVDDKGGTVKDTGDIELKDGASATVGGEGGKPGTTITAPKNQGGTTGTTTVTPKDDGTVDVGSGGTVSTGGKNGETGTPVTLPSGGSVKPEDGAVKPTGGVAGVDTDGDGKADTLINLPSGGSGGAGTDTIKPNDQGGVDVPGGTELKGTTDGTTPDSQSKVVVGAQGGSVNGEGGVDLPKGGTATVDNGTGKTNSEITAGENGGTVKPNPGGTADVSGSGTIIQVGGGSGNKPPVTVDDKGGTVKDTGEIELKDGASATVGGGSGKPGTTITAPKNQGGNPGSTTVTPKDDGTVDVGSGGTVTTGGKNGETGTPVTLPSGGSVKPEDGTIKPVGNTIATGEDKDGDGVPDTVIVLPESSTGITPGEDGGVKIPGGSTIQGGDGLSTTLPEGGELTPEGGVKPSGNTLTIEGGEGKPTVTIKLPEDGAVSGSGDGGLQVPPNTEIKQAGGNTPSVTVGENGGSVDKDGGVTLPAGGSATITGSNGTDSITVKTPQGGKVNTADGSTVAPEVEINGTTVTAPANGTVKTDQAGSTQAGPGAVIAKGDAQVTVSEGAAVLVDKDGNLTFPSGGKVEVTRNGVTQTVTIPSGGTIKPPDYSRPSSNSGSQSGSGGSGGDSDSGVGTSYAPFTKQPEHGKIKVSPSFPIAGDRVSIVITPENGYKVDTVTVTDRNGKSVTVTKQADGTYTFIQPEGGVTVSAVMKAADGSCSKDSSCPVHAFADLSVTAWYHDGVHYCLEEGLMSGYGKGTFGPQNALSRAMLAQILYSRAGYPAVSGSSPFDDVAPDAWYANAITWAADSGIVGGYGNGKFGPEDPITREQLAAMLYRCAQVEEEDAFERENGNILGYKDYEGISEYAVPALQWAVGSGIMSGKGDGILDPTGKATRAEAAVMLMQFCKLSDQ